MSKHLEQKSPAKHEISAALDDKDLEMVTGGDKPVRPKTVTWTHDDESPKEEVTFEYGAI
jgi:hypothetical protein